MAGRNGGIGILIMNKCKQCIRNTPFPIGICEHCGAKGFVITLNRHCLTGECHKCGFSSVGSSFFAPCEMDKREYRVKILDDIRSNYLILAIGRAMKINSLTLKKAIESKKTVEKTYDLKEIMAIQTVLKHNNIAFCIDPVPEYKEFYRCNRKIL